MSLTTPVPRDADAAFPGENWFFYWKTSSSLWQTKLQELSGSGPVIIPLNWSFHSETGDTYDFAENRPETNLKRLVEIVEEMGREPIFFLPLTPAPFLPNGGVPHLLARVMALNVDRMGHALLDSERRLYKLYSFFDPRVFQGFSKFVRRLGEYFVEEGIASDLVGIECGHLSQGDFQSFLFDRSKAYDQAFSRFLRAKREENGDEFIQSPEQEYALAKEFHQTIRELYEKTAQESLAGNWEGKLNVCFLGSSPTQTFQRIQSTDLSRDYSRDLFLSLSKNLFPTSVLLSPKAKKGVFGKQLQELVGQAYIEGRLKSEFFEDETAVQYRPLCFFELYESEVAAPFWKDRPRWYDWGVPQALYRRYLWTFRLHQERCFEWNEELVDRDVIHFVRGSDVTDKAFNDLLKHFMSGGKVILERSTMEKRFSKKLEGFFLENGLHVEKVNLLVPVHNVYLGAGQLMVVDADKLLEKPLEKRLGFWDKLLQTFEVSYLPLPEVEGIEAAWRTRGSSPSELNFEEVRRLSLYNPTSYRKKMKIPMGGHFALTKVVDEQNVKVHSSGQELDIEFWPEGSVSLDFGVFS